MSLEQIKIVSMGDVVDQQAESLKKISSLLHKPGFRIFRPFAHRMAGLIRTTERLSFQEAPQAHEKDCQYMTVLSANLWHDWPQHRRTVTRLEAFACMVEEHNADVLLLQEVARTSSFWSDQWLAKRLGMSYVYSRANGHLKSIGFEEGLAIFSRFPLENPVLRQLSPNRNHLVRRMALGSQIVSPCGKFFVVSVHLGLVGKQNLRQTVNLKTWVQEAADGLPALVGGDFNRGEHSRPIKLLKADWIDTFRHLNPFADGTTHKFGSVGGKSFLRSRLDYIFLKAGLVNWKVLESRHLENVEERHSDHHAVLLRLAPVHI